MHSSMIKRIFVGLIFAFGIIAIERNAAYALLAMVSSIIALIVHLDELKL